MAAAISRLQPVGDPKDGRVPAKAGSVIYCAAEQSAGRIKHAYESRILDKPTDYEPRRAVDLNFCVVREPWDWQIDEPVGDAKLVDLISDLRPTMIVLDPLVYFHSMDENDPKLVRPLVPLRKAVLSYGGALVLVHHTRKPSNDAKPMRAGDPADWSRVRGTSALWGMADAGIMATRLAVNSINITSEFKDFPPDTWTWIPK